MVRNSVRSVDYEARRRAILTTTIDLHIKGAAPVASEDIADLYDLSPATIRNIFAELEQDGYLMHPYTSGGRIPTGRGYRYYVDYLISQMELLEDEKARILNEYRRRIGRLEEVLEQTSEMVSAITHYAAIVSFAQHQEKMIYRGLSQVMAQPEFRSFEAVTLLVRAVEEKRRLLDIINRDFSGKVMVYIGDELALPEMKNCALVVSAYSCKRRPSGRIAVLGPARMEYRHIIPMLEYVSEVVSKALDDIEG